MPKHMLVVDDDPAIRDLIRTAFSSADCVVAEAESGQRGLAQLRERRPDLVLLDVQMPGESGFDVLHKMRADETLRHVPVIMLTAKRSEKDVLLAREMRVVDYLAKPINIIHLARRVERVLNAALDADIWAV